MRRLWKRLSELFMLVLRMLTEDFRSEEEKEGGKEKKSAAPKRDHTYNKGRDRLFEEALIVHSLTGSRRTPDFAGRTGKNAAADSLVIPEYLPEPGS